MKKQIVISVILTIFVVASLSADPDRRRGSRQSGAKFETLDKNNDNLISKKEWLARFQEIDTNGDGSISRDEMQAHRLKMRRTRRD